MDEDEHLDCDLGWLDVDPDPATAPNPWVCPVCGCIWDLKVFAHYEPRES